MRHLISPLDFSVEELDKLLDLANDIEANPKKYAHACDGKKLATLFYEPSTRTRLSHEAAMLNLGGSVLGFSSAKSSSAAKGESVSDTIRMINCYADICAMRHPKEGAAAVACPPCNNSGHQCRRRRTSASNPNSDRFIDNPFLKRTAGQHDDWIMWGFEIRAYRTFSDSRTGKISRYPIHFNFTGGASPARLYET